MRLILLRCAILLLSVGATPSWSQSGSGKPLDRILKQVEKDAASSMSFHRGDFPVAPRDVCPVSTEYPSRDGVKVTVSLCSTEIESELQIVHVALRNLTTRPIELEIPEADVDFFVIQITGRGIKRRPHPDDGLSRHEARGPQWSYQKLDPSSSVARTTKLNDHVVGQFASGWSYRVSVRTRFQFRYLDDPRPAQTAFLESFAAGKRTAFRDRVVFEDVVLRKGREVNEKDR